MGLDVAPDVAPDAARARALGCREATGEWICFLDPGDVWLPEKLEAQVALIEDADLAYSDCRFLLGETLSPVTYHQLFPPPRPGEDPLVALIDRDYVPYSTLAVRAEVFRAAGGFDLTAGPAAFFDLCLRLLARGARPKHVAQPLADQRVRLERMKETHVEAQEACERVLRSFAKSQPLATSHPAYRTRAEKRADGLARARVRRNRPRRQRPSVRLRDSGTSLRARMPLRELAAEGVYLASPTVAGWMGMLVEPSSAADHLKDLILRAEPTPADPKASVIIACHNYGHFLSEAIDSVLAQTHTNLEIIVVDDGSTDNTAEVASRYAGRVVYWYQPNSGPSAARNAGIHLSSGHYVAFLDADDWMEPDFVAECLRALDDHPEAAYAFPQVFFFGRQEAVSRYPQYHAVSAGRRRIPMCAVFRHTAFRNTRFDEGLRSGLVDWDLYNSLAERGLQGVLVDRPLVHVRTHATGVSITDRLVASPHRRRTLLLRLRIRHLPLFSLEDWGRFLNMYGREFLGETKRWALRRGSRDHLRS